MKPFKNQISGDLLKCKCCGQHFYNIYLIAKLNYLLDLVREKYHKELAINSVYRCPAHNAKVGGVFNSYHVRGMAADVTVEGVDPNELAALAETVGFNGIGIYKTFVHVDIRETPARWTGKQPLKNGKEAL